MAQSPNDADPRSPALSPAERRFVACYLANGRKGAKAWREAVEAGAAPRVASRKAAAWLARDPVRAALARAERRARARTGAVIERYAITEERVLSELASLAFSRPMDLMRVTADGGAVVDLSALDERQAAAIAELTVDEYVAGKGEEARPVKRTRVKLVDKLRALTLLGLRLGLWKRPAEGARSPGLGGGFAGGGLSALLAEATRLAQEGAVNQEAREGAQETREGAVENLGERDGDAS
ncbi:hypothetical protein CKO38_16735 [Rhodospirillum rubrum]|uniref:terminase small subunit n=1 Tax=Rhodospirillum rubrum TaxID=1085 RepID=UPI001904BBDA|nr:terminase small subunit [Rhodospirillum rubrum]MBK1666149.1 hypothetical protein [Rhodospirillum rubrum]MBK1678289.1 hypothetical protein [Rhodospirillum rubrum]